MNMNDMNKNYMIWSLR